MGAGPFLLLLLLLNAADNSPRIGAAQHARTGRAYPLTPRTTHRYPARMVTLQNSIRPRRAFARAVTTANNPKGPIMQNATATQSGISPGLFSYMIRAEVANGATLAQIAEKSGQPVATIVDVLNNVTPLARTEALAELRAASAEVTA